MPLDIATTEDMPLRAFGAYMRRLRELRGITQAGLTAQLHGDPSERTIGRWENGRHEPSISEMSPVIEFLGGSLTRAVLLIMSDKLTEADAQRMADSADDDLTPDEMTFFASLSPKQRRLLRQFIEAEEADG